MNWKPFIFGGLASVVAECGTFPIDLTKTRLQIQGQVVDAAHQHKKYRGMLHAMLRIGQEEGMRALYSGIAPAVLRQATYGTIKIGIYHSLKNHIVAWQGKGESLHVNLFSGVVAGVVSSCIANPTDVLKIRMQAHSSTAYASQGLLSSFAQIYREEKLRGLWRGVGPTAQRAAIVSSVELGIYDWSKKHFLDRHWMEDGVPLHFVASAIAGLCGAVASNPIDVIKTRMMNQKALKDNRALYRGTIDCAIKTIHHEGFFALYKGFIPLYLRLGPWNMLFFMTYEQLKLLHQRLS